MPESHRSDNFINDFQSTKQLLCQLTGARRVEILMGSGTLANDAVAAQLSLEGKKGFVLANGEFGERLADHARRFGLDFDLLQYPWEKPFDLLAIEMRLKQQPIPGWLWCSHCETSTGRTNDLA